MITNNFKTYMALILSGAANGISCGLLPIVNVSGVTYYAANNVYNSMPSDLSQALTLSATERGISFGSGNTAATANDYNLESTITSGLSAFVNRFNALDNNGNPYLQLDIMLSNTSDNPITVKEIGYKQYLRCSDAADSKSLNSRVFLLDRTVLPAPVTIPVNDYVIIRYTLKTIISAGE